MIQVAKKIPFDDPNVLNACRAAYVASNLVILGIYYYVKTVIDKNKGMIVRLSSRGALPRRALTRLLLCRHDHP